MIGVRDVTLKDDGPKELLLDKHEKYLRHYANDDSGTDQILAEHLRMSAMYWGLNALDLMNTLGDDQAPEVMKALEFIRRCQTEDGGFSAAYRHDSHITHTLSAVQMLVILKKLNFNYINVEKCVQYIKSLQLEDGSFSGDKWGEVDTRFSFCALATLRLLDRLDAVDIDKAVEYVMLCNNQIDGGFGCKPGAESHSAYVYCCVGSLAITDRLNLIDADQLGWWLSKRQLPSGGLNGRPEKLPDLCYSWWILSSMKMINRIDLIDHQKLLSFILACQDEDQGGFSDRPGDQADPYHTMFGIASVSLICHHRWTKKDNETQTDNKNVTDDKKNNDETLIEKFKCILRPVNPVLCMPEDKLSPG